MLPSVITWLQKQNLEETRARNQIEGGDSIASVVFSATDVLSPASSMRPPHSVVILCAGTKSAFSQHTTRQFIPREASPRRPRNMRAAQAQRVV